MNERSSSAPTPFDTEPAAGGGLLDRRRFLRSGLTLSGFAFGGAAFAAPEGLSRPDSTRRPGLGFSNYGQPSPAERETIRWIANNAAAPGSGISWTPLHRLEGIVTPSGLHFERHHNGVPTVAAHSHRLVIHGQVKQALAFDYDDLLRYPLRSRLCFIECGGNSNSGWNSEPLQTAAGWMHGLVSCSEWTGVPLADLLEEAGVLPEARWVIAEGADAAMINASIPIGKAMDDTLVALYQNGEPLRPENGYPLRLVVPGWEGVTHIKWLKRLHLAAQPAMARNETAKYTELQPNGRARQFTFPMQAKSIITRPSPGIGLRGPNVYAISGLAWSGAGRIARVQVSADGGQSWADAALEQPVLPQCFTRFRIPWRWDGGPAVLQSRAIDETGYEQPRRAKLVAEQGRNGYFHYHAIVSWAVDSDGSLRHVYA